MISRGIFLILVLLISGCTSFQDPVTANVDRTAVFAYGSYCAVPPDSTRTALSYAETGFAYVEQQCGIFYDNLAALTQNGRFTVKALNATNLGAASILQAAKVAAANVTIVGSALTLTEAVFNSFVEQYAFAPYLYKLRELTWQAFDKHTQDNDAKLKALDGLKTSDSYCSAYVLVQQHASICTLSYIQMLFDQQVANPTKVVDAGNDSKGAPVVPAKPAAPAAATRGLMFGRGASATPPRASSILPSSPNYTIR